MNQISDALRASIAKKEDRFAKQVNEALMHLPRVMSEMNDGVVTALSRQEAIDHLIRDGVLGARPHAKRIAHAKKYNLPLDAWNARLADKIMGRALEIAQADGKVALFGDGRTMFEIRWTQPFAIGDTPATSSEPLDADEAYPLRENLPRHRTRQWELSQAHE